MRSTQSLLDADRIAKNLIDLLVQRASVALRTRLQECDLFFLNVVDEKIGPWLVPPLLVASFAHSIFTPSSRMIFDHFASSRTMAAAYSSGVPGVGSAPSWVIRATTSSDASAARSAALS